MWVSGQRHTPELYNHETEPVSIEQGAGRTPGPVWTRAENLVPHWNCTCNHKYLFVMLLLYVSAPIRLHHGSHLQRNTFIINAV
jgi:hypothetical protein